MDDLEKESLTELRVTDVYEDITSEKITCRQRTTKFTIKGNVIQSVLKYSKSELQKARRSFILISIIS